MKTKEALKALEANTINNITSDTAAEYGFNSRDAVLSIMADIVDAFQKVCMLSVSTTLDFPADFNCVLALLIDDTGLSVLMTDDEKEPDENGEIPKVIFSSDLSNPEQLAMLKHMIHEDPCIVAVQTDTGYQLATADMVAVMTM